MTYESVMAEGRRLERAGDPQAALALLRDQLRQDAFESEELQSVGRITRRLLQSPGCDQPHQKVLVLGQCTTTWLTYTLMAVALQRSLPCIVSDGPYDNVLQSLDELTTSDVPDVLVLLPWQQRLLRDGDDYDERISQELAFWQRVWNIAAERGIRRLVQVGYDWTSPGARGFHLGSGRGGDIDLVRRTNQALRDVLPSGSYFVPLEEISGILGRQQFYDSRRQHWTRQPFGEVGLRVLSEHVVAGVRALTIGPRKVLVVDLDNTLWGGVVGETGALGIELGDSPTGAAFRGFQRHLRALSRRGVLLAVCSKNNEADARSAFQQNPDMVLGLDDFAHFVANWEPKTDGIRRIADELRLGLDSFVFFDDNPFERDMVRQTLPQVEVVNVPDDPSSYVDALQSGLWFESCGLTVEDLQRTQLYATETQRRAAEITTSSISEYLASLSMMGNVRSIDAVDMQRVVQLLAKTNQFNLTTRRHTADDVRRLLSVRGSVGLSLRVTDRFADHGLIALAIGVPDPASGPSTLRIDSFLMSCRVIGRTVEAFLLQALLRLATEQGYARVVGEFAPSAKNQIAASFFEEMGFTPTGAAAQGCARWFELALPTPGTVHTFVAGHG
jgi:FkbH-like protein